MIAATPVGMENNNHFQVIYRSLPKIGPPLKIHSSTKQNLQVIVLLEQLHASCIHHDQTLSK